jgi:hypothetical protein
MTIDDHIPNTAKPTKTHPDDVAVDNFAVAMKEKLAIARGRGRSGWGKCDPAHLSAMLYEHVQKGDPRDVANFCMFLWNLGQPITPCKPTQAEPVAWRLNHGNGFFREFTTGVPTEVAKAHWKRMGVTIEYAYLHPAPAVAQEPVHFRAVLCREQQDQAIGVVPKVVGFVDKKAAEQFILEKRDFQGWRYNLEPLYTEAPAIAHPPAEVVRELVEALSTEVHRQLKEGLAMPRDDLKRH